MGRADAEPSLHLRLMDALERGAHAQQHSHELVAAHAALDEKLRASLAQVRARRRQAQATRRRA
jgi:hypothetical protein